MGKRKVNSCKGLTINELATAIGIIGIIAAVAVPNFMRIKWEVNVEMVRQNLKVIHEALNEWFNENGAFPDDVFNLPGGSPEEQAITANLGAVDLKQYRVRRYRIRPRSGYIMEVEPADPVFRSEENCFEMDSLGVRRVRCASFAFSNTVLSMTSVTGNNPQGMWFDVNAAVGDPNEIPRIANIFAPWGIDSFYNYLQTSCTFGDCPAGATPSAFVEIGPADRQLIRDRMGDLETHFANQGYTFHYAERTYEEVKATASVTVPLSPPGYDPQYSDADGYIEWTFERIN
jgi:Tfp pilus assembly protein PilE